MNKQSPTPSTVTADASRVERLQRELAEAKAEIAKQELEVEQIAQIQEELLPQTPPPLDGYRFATSYIAPGKAGGDYYDFFSVDRGDETESVIIVIADASGHGPAAAVIMAMMHSLLHAFVDDETNPDQILSHMNQELAEKELSSAMVTGLVVELSAANRTIKFASAGHHLPLVRHRDGNVVELECRAAGLPLAVDKDASYGTSQVDLQSGDTVLLYTDGVIEAQNPDGEELGVSRLVKTLRAGPPTAAELIANVNGVVRRHREGEALTDDKTLLAIEVHP